MGRLSTGWLQKNTLRNNISPAPEEMVSENEDVIALSCRYKNKLVYKRKKEMDIFHLSMQKD